MPRPAAGAVFDAVGDYAEVRVNGQQAGQHLGPLLPFEIDISGLIAAPSTINRLEVLVKDDTFFSVPRPSSDWRNRRYWLPRGMAQTTAKASTKAFRCVCVPRYTSPTSACKHLSPEAGVTAICELFNSQRETARVRLSGSVQPWPSGPKTLSLPEVVAELPGYVTTKLSLEAAFQPADVTLRQPYHPALYILRRCSLADAADGRRLQRCDTRFGFREVGFDGIHFRLNGIRCNLRGESPAYSEKAGMMSSREAAIRMVQRYRAANYNVLRFHSCPRRRTCWTCVTSWGCS